MEIRKRTLRGVLVYMRGNRFAVDDVGRDAVLICADGRNGAQRARVDLLAPVADDTNDDFLPTVLSPSLAAFAFTEISDVLHDAMHGTREQRVVLIVHRHDDEELRPAGRVVVYLAQCESVVLEIVRIARRSRIAHMCELALVFECAEVEQFGRHSRVEHKVTVEEPVNMNVSFRLFRERIKKHALDALESLVASGHALWDTSVADIVVHFVVTMRWSIDIVLSWHVHVHRLL